jgi:hypothetical protein
MIESRRGWAPAVTLLLLAVSAGIAWRVELERRSGWDGLAWIGYFHWAVPLCVGLFIAWTVWAARVRHPAVFVLALTCFAAAGYSVVSLAVHLMYSRFGSIKTFGIAISVWPLIPLLFCLLFGAPISLGRAIGSTALFVVSWPAAIFVRGFFEQIGAPDVIHAVKSGFVIPFLILSLGFPLLRIPARSFRPSGGETT